MTATVNGYGQRDRPWGFRVTAGEIPLHRPWGKIGYNPDVDATQETMWPLGTRYTWPAAPQQMEVTSSGAQDTAAGTGVRTVYIGYLDGNGIQRSETVTMAGAGVVTTTATDIYRINAFRAATVGGTAGAAGNIELRNLADTPVYGYIAAGQTRQRGAFYAVPAAMSLYVDKVAVCCVTGTANPQYARFGLYATWDDNLGPLAFLQMQLEMVIEEQSVLCELPRPMFFPAMTDIEMTAIGQGALSSAVCECGLFGELVG